MYYKNSLLRSSKTEVGYCSARSSGCNVMQVFFTTNVTVLLTVSYRQLRYS